MRLLRYARNDSEWLRTIRQCLVVFFLSRTLILFIIVLSSQVSLEEIPGREGRNYHPIIALNFEETISDLEAVLLSGDASWYIGIAKDGYDHESSPSLVPRNWTFFPFFPALLRLTHILTGNYFIAGILIANLSFIASLIVFANLGPRLGYTAEETSRALWLLAFFPTSYFFSAPHTEAVFLLLVLLSYLALTHGRLLLAGGIFALAGATRPTGLLLLPGFALSLFTHSNIPMPRRFVTVSLASLGGLAFMGYLYYLTGDPFAFASNQLHWGRGEQSTLELLQGFIAVPGKLMIGWNFLLLNALCAVMALGIGIRLYLTGRKDFALIVVLPVAIALSTGTVQSLARFVVVLFPVFLWLGQFATAREREWALIAIFTTLLTLMAAMYGAHLTAGMA